MADLTAKPISELPAASNKSWVDGANDMDNDLFAICRSAGSTLYSRRLTGAQLRGFIAPVQTFYGIASIDVPSGPTINDAVAAMPNGSIGVFTANSFAAADMPEGTTQTGTVYIFRVNGPSNSLVICNRGAGTYIRTPTLSGQTGAWRKLSAYEDLADYTLSLNSGVTGWSIANGGNKAYRRNGVCYLDMILTCTADVGTSAATIITLPDALKPAFEIKARGSSGQSGADINIGISTAGAVSVSRSPANTASNARFFLAYPAAT